MPSGPRPARRGPPPEPGARWAQPLRFLVAGGFSTAVNWLSRFPLSRVFPFDLAVALAYGVGMLAGFALYRSWVFAGSRHRLARQLGGFLVVNALGLCVVVAGTRAALELFAALPEGPARAAAHAAGLALGAAFNFVGHRTVSFARRRPAP